MLDNIIPIIEYVIDSFIHIWPYLLITIPIAVAVKMTGASKFISRAFSARPVVAIILATLVGAFSPLCSCSVVPVVAAMLIGGVPLAPVMSFWLASPSMDPEIFFLTVSSLGWELAVWRLASTLILSLSSGFITHILAQRGWLGKDILKKVRSTQVKTLSQTFKEGLQTINRRMKPRTPNFGLVKPALSLEAAACSDPGCDVNVSPTIQLTAISAPAAQSLPIHQSGTSQPGTCSTDANQSCSTEKQIEPSLWMRLANETWIATTMVIKFMLMAWFIGALIHLYVPEQWINGILGGENHWSILTAALLGVPVYTSNLTAMPLVDGLLAHGMHPAAALSFLIAGPMTTLPAMSAVWGLVNRKVFAIYIAFALIGAVLFGYLFNIVLSF